MPTYTIEIKGDGGEFIAGEVKKEFLDALEENDISIEDYADGDSDDEQFECIPEEIRPFDPGCWFDIHPYITHMNQCDIARMELSVTNEDCETVYDGGPYSGSEHIHDNWSEHDNGVVSFSIYDPDNEYLDKCIYTCQRDEDGVFFSGEIELDEPFDPKKLCLMTINLNELDMITKVVYYPQLDEDGDPVGDYIEIENEAEGETDVNGATHELRML
jgi:hypothetical protein